MKILLINTYEHKGGAAKAVFRLFKGLKQSGVDTTLLVNEKSPAGQDIITAGGKFGRLFNPIRPYLDFAIPLMMTRSRTLFSTSVIPEDTVKIIKRINPDVVHLNWITGGMIRIENLAKIDKPVVWTLHDLWAFTGGCHYPMECTKFRISCGSCPLLHSSCEKDLSSWVFNRKQKTYSGIRALNLVTPGTWLERVVRSSALLNGCSITMIPNGLDTSLFRPGNKLAARNKFALPADKKIILFGGIRGVKNPVKGFKLLLEAIALSRRNDLELVVFGSREKDNHFALPCNTRFIGPVSDESVLASLFPAADLVAVPSFQEVFGQVASEALSCGIPVLAFAATGLLDIVDHKENGYLAKPFDSSDLAHGINWIIEQAGRTESLSANARAKAENHFEILKVTGKYLDLYQKLI